MLNAFNSAVDPMNLELYEVSRDGQTKQLTQLAPTAYVWESSFSWSPDSRYLAMFLAPHLGAANEPARVAVLDTTTLNVIDYCLPITSSGKGPIWSPIWSPDSRQFVITDWYEQDHRHMILVDIENNIAAQIADDVEPVGWISP